jgi:hypothetical protein
MPRSSALRSAYVVVAAFLVTGCSSATNGSTPTSSGPPEDSKPAATIISDARAALAAVSSVAVHYQLGSNGGGADERFVVTPSGSTPVSTSFGCLTVQRLVALLKFDPAARVAAVATFNGQKVIVLENGPTWDMQVIDGNPPLPLEVSYIADQGQVTFTFSAVNLAVASPVQRCAG